MARASSAPGLRPVELNRSGAPNQPRELGRYEEATPLKCRHQFFSRLEIAVDVVDVPSPKDSLSGADVDGVMLDFDVARGSGQRGRAVDAHHHIKWQQGLQHSRQVRGVQRQDNLD